MFTAVLFGSCRSSGDGGDAPLLIEPQNRRRKPLSLQVDGTQSGVSERSHPSEAGGLRQEGVDLTLGLRDGAFGRVEGAMAESSSRV